MEENPNTAQGYDIYFSSNCHVCKIPQGSEKGAKFCSRCKLIQYCSVAHQKQDWPKHKDFCNAISVMLNKTNSNHVFSEAIDGNLSHERWKELRRSLLKLLGRILKRPLLVTEMQMIMFPPLCNLSRCYQPNQMFPCKHCNSVMYCSEAHKTLDHKHNDVCQELTASYQVGMMRYWQQCKLESSGFEILKDFDDLPSNMDSLFCQRSHEAEISSEHRLVSELLSYFLSMAFVLKKFGPKKSLSFTVHVVGADAMEILALHTLPFIVHLLPGFEFYKIVLIGPGVSVSKDNHVLEEIPKNCSVSVVGETLYLDYVNSPSYEHPDLIAAFNCGFCEFRDIPQKDTWKESLSCIMNSSTNTQILITSYTENESVADLQRLCSSSCKESHFEILMNSQINPFASLFPYRDWENEDSGVFYGNKCMSVVQI